MTIGDRLDTDILMGQQASMPTPVVLTGATTRVADECLVQPTTYVVDDLGSIPALVA